MDRIYDRAHAIAGRDSVDWVGEANSNVTQSLWAIWGVRPIAFA